MAVGVNADKTSNKYLHLGWRSATQGFTFAFWSNDYDYTGTSTLGITKDLNWLENERQNFYPTFGVDT